MRFSFLLFSLVAAAACVIAAAQDATSTCFYDLVTGTVGANKTTTLYSFPQPMTSIRITYIGSQVSSATGESAKKKGEGTDYCLVQHQNTYPFLLAVRATSQDNSVSLVTRDFDVRDMAVGSLASVLIQVPNISVFSLVMTNLGTHAKCKLNVEVMLCYDDATNDPAETPAPVLVGASPPTIYANSQSATSLILRYPDGSDLAEIRDSTVSLVELSDKCDGGTGSIRYLAYQKNLPGGLLLSNGTGTLAARSYKFTEEDAGSYRVCYRRNGDTSTKEIAVVQIFAGNPSYYEVITDDDNGRVYVGTPVSLKFYGYDLDTRPDGDNAKLVEETETCKDGRPAAGVPIATDLGPSDNYGPNTTFTIWTFQMTYGGVFKVCYRRSKTKVWTEVPSIEDVGPVPNMPTGEPNSYPTPTDPNTKEACDMAPANTKEQPWVNYRSVKLVLTTSKLPEGFMDTLATLLCVPRAGLMLTHVSHDASNNQLVYLSVLCEDLNKGGASVCSTLERHNYVVSLGKRHSPLLSENGIKSVEGSTSMFAFDDDPSSRKGGSKGLIVFLSIMLCSVTLALIVVVIKYRSKREYFVQFGMDDGDLDDMYEAGAMPAPMEVSHYQAPRGGPSSAAVIEIEE